MNFIQIVPGLYPRVDGIGDYALQLARRLREKHDVISSFVVADPMWQGGDVDGFYATGVRSRTARGLVETIARCEHRSGTELTPLLLHFSPYGYQKRGYPLWLEHTLEGWDERQFKTLNIVFHELEVNCWRPWSSAFWISALQRNLISHVAKLGQFQYTNTEFYRQDLEKWGAGRVSLIPNFSTVGEPAVNPPFASRRNDVIVFGRAAQRKANYQRGSVALASLCRMIAAERIIDIGEPIAGDTRTDIEGFPIIRCGRLDAQAVNHWMASSVASFIAYPIPLLPKSSVHAVSCAHGTIPFVFDNQKKELSCPGLVNGEDYIALTSGGIQPFTPRLDQLSEIVFNNYQARNSWAAAARVAKHIFG